MRIQTGHRRTPALAGVVSPPAHRRAPSWAGPVPIGDRQPLVWLLGAHGGAGVSSLEHCLPFTADCGDRWPAVIGSETPLVVVVARETIAGISSAHDLLRQYCCGLAGPSTLLGLVTVAARSGRVQADIRRYRAVVAGLVEHEWRISWHNDWLVTDTIDLPVWASGYGSGRRSSAMPKDINDFAEQLAAAVTTKSDPDGQESKEEPLTPAC